MTTTEKQLLTIQARYDNAVGTIEARLYDKILFNFGIVWQPADGWTILNIDSTHVAPIGFCLKIIELKGQLSEEDFLRYSI